MRQYSWGPFTITELVEFIIRDYEKVNGAFSIHGFLKAYLIEPGIKYVFWLRITRFCYLNKLLLPVFLFSRVVLKHYSYK